MVLIFPSCALTFTAGPSIWWAPICHGHPGAVLESGEPWLSHGAGASCPWCRGCTRPRAPSLSSATGTASVHPDQHTEVPSQPYVRTCATTCTVTGSHTCQCTHKLAGTHEDQCWGTQGAAPTVLCSCACTQCTDIWLCTHCGKSLCLAGMSQCRAHTLVPVHSQGRWIWGPHAWPGEMALGSPRPTEGGPFGSMSLCRGALRCPWPSIRPCLTVTQLRPCLSGCR